MTPEYLAFLAAKAPRPMASGIEPSPMPDHLFDFQADATAFCLRQRRKFLGLELKGSYFDVARKNLINAEAGAVDLFDAAD